MLRAAWKAPCQTLLLLVGGTIGCVRYARYTAAPLDPVHEAEAYSARRLDDQALSLFLSDHGAPPADSGFTPSALGLAALYFRSDVAVSREAVRAARAAEITAGTRPQPSANATVQRLSRPDGAPSPWTISLTTGLTFETGGKRSARIARARAFTLASALRLEATGWQLAQDARRAAVASLGAERDLADVAAETIQLRTVLGLLRARYDEGQLSLAEIARAESDIQSSVLALAQARRARTDARAALARALGVALARVRTLPIRADTTAGAFSIGAVSACAAASANRDDDPADTLRTIALRTRYDVGAALADYAVAESDLRLEIARQYPDVNVAPGIAWDRGALRWILGLGTPAIPVARNRGPIAEALARRAQQAARATLVQDSVLAQVDSAAAGCRETQAEIAAADSLVAARAEQFRLITGAFARGETGQTEVALARLTLIRVTRARRQALVRREVAGVALEAALGRWPSEPGIRWPVSLEAIGSAGTPQRSSQENRR